MADADLMTIGRFAHLSGLSIHALRHYDDIDLLTPADVDPDSGYRRYRHDQLAVAQLIGALRWIDLPLNDIRVVLRDPDSPQARDLLARHRARLVRQRDLLTARIGDLDHQLTKGVTMPTPQPGCRPVQLKIAVDDVAAAVTFYQQAFDLTYDVTRRTDDADYSSFVFGRYGQDDFFLMHLQDGGDDTDHPGPSTFGLLVDDLDARHTRALAAGATELVAPRDLTGMPRSSAVKDPSGNWIWLYQG